MKNLENQKSPETTSIGTLDRIFKLERQLDQMRTYVQQNEPQSNESEDLKNKVEYFKKEVEKLTIELLQLRLKHRDEESGK